MSTYYEELKKRESIPEIEINKGQPNLLFNQKTYNSINEIFKEPQNPKISIHERALKFFEDVLYCEDIKETLYRLILQKDRKMNVLLIGPAACSKTMLCRIIEDGTNGTVFFDATASSGAGLIEVLRENPRAKIVIIDEISEMKKNDIEVLRGLLADGRISKTLKTTRINLKMENVKIIATCNNPSKLSIPIRSRFIELAMDAYTDDEFRDIMVFLMVKQNIVNEYLARQIADTFLFYNITNVRKALSIALLISPDDKIEDIRRNIENIIYNDGSGVNHNYNIIS